METTIDIETTTIAESTLEKSTSNSFQTTLMPSESSIMTTTSSKSTAIIQQTSNIELEISSRTSIVPLTTTIPLSTSVIDSTEHNLESTVETYSIPSITSLFPTLESTDSSSMSTDSGILTSSAEKRTQHTTDQVEVNSVSISNSQIPSNITTIAFSSICDYCALRISTRTWKTHPLPKVVSKKPPVKILMNPDDRPIAIFMGSTSIIIVIAFGILIIIIDLSSFIRDLKKMKRNVTSFVRYYRDQSDKIEMM